MASTERIFELFSELNRIPRPSHHEERVADYLCRFAERLGLEYERDKENCVVIRKPATPGHESAETIVLLNHMDMVCVGMNDPLQDPVTPVVEDGWMKARGTSLGADNGIGLAMALAVLEDDSIVHPALEVITTTNEEDGMSGAAQLSPDFIKGRKVINLDSEDYDTITTGAAGATLQLHRLPIGRTDAPVLLNWFRVTISGGLGGHSGVDINKGRCSAYSVAHKLLKAVGEVDLSVVADIQIGEANASIASSGEIVFGLPCGFGYHTAHGIIDATNRWIKEEFGQTDPGMTCSVEVVEEPKSVILAYDIIRLLHILKDIPQGVVAMSETMPGTVHTSNNVGRIVTNYDHILIPTHTRSFSDSDMNELSAFIAKRFATYHATSETVMNAPAWQENQDSPFINLVSDTFLDVLGWRPRKVAMHFVLEAGFFVRHYPGIQIASIGPRILEPHSTSERVELRTIGDIWQVLLELLRRLA